MKKVLVTGGTGTLGQEIVKLLLSVNEFYNLFTSGVNLCPDYTFGKITWEHYINNMTKNNNNSST